VIDLRLTEDAARALMRLRHSEDWLTILRFLAASTNELRAANDAEMDVNLLRQRQGAIQMLTTIEALPARSKDLLLRVEAARQASQ
jgi:hypothetical protein